MARVTLKAGNTEITKRRKSAGSTAEHNLALAIVAAIRAHDNAANEDEYRYGLEKFVLEELKKK